MKITSYSVKNTAPIKRFEISNLSEVVVLAGPNGVGKTTLLNGLLQLFQNPNSNGTVAVTVQATNPDEVKAWGGRQSLSTAVPAEAQALRAHLQRGQKRGALSGGVLNFDSARAFVPIQPYTWSFLFADPSEEDIGWNMSFQPMNGRFQDMMHALIRKSRSQKEQIANQALRQIGAGQATLDLSPYGDPLIKFKDAFSRLLPGKTMLGIDEQNQIMRYTQDGQSLEFTRLSSGEREVVTIVFDFLLRNPKDCIVVFDEPELHLHPELCYRLLRTLQDVGERNQFIYCTHSPEIITATLGQTVAFVSPAKANGENQALKVEENDEVASVLRALGHSIGVISLGKKIVLIEGESESLDKETYGNIVGARCPGLVLVPTKGKGAITGFQKAIETVLNKTIWGVDFFMLCDGDSVAYPIAGDSNRGRLRRLSRYHLENYFLDEMVWVKVFEGLAVPASDPLRDPQKVRAQIRDAACTMIAYAASLRVVNQFRQLVGNVDLMPKGLDQASLEDGLRLVEERRSLELERCATCLDQAGVREAFGREYRQIEAALRDDTEHWKVLIPGRQVLNKFCSKTQHGRTTLKRLYIRAAGNIQPSPFEEISSIFRDFEGGKL